MRDSSPEKVVQAIKSSFPDSDEQLLLAVVQRYKGIDVWNTDIKMKKEDYDPLSYHNSGRNHTDGPEFEKITASSELW